MKYQRMSGSGQDSGDAIKKERCLFLSTFQEFYYSLSQGS